MKIDHIGYLVKDIDKSVEQFRQLGYEVRQNTVYDELRDVNICFMEQQGYVIELVAPCSDKSVVHDQLKKMGQTPYHVCYRVDNLEETVEELRAKKYVIMREPEVAVALAGKRVVFMYHRSVGMIELVEE